MWRGDWVVAVRGVGSCGGGLRRKFLFNDMQMQATLGLYLDRRLLCGRGSIGMGSMPTLSIICDVGSPHVTFCVRIRIGG